MKIELDSFCLRKPILKDAVALKEIRNDEQTMLYYGLVGAYPKTLHEAEECIKWAQSCFDNGGGRWTITEKESDQYIGDVGFFNYSEDHNKVELGYVLQRSHWNKGIISSAIATLVERGFTIHKYNRIEALVDTRNKASQKVLKKNGFTLEGTLREYECEYGDYVDLQMYSILRREYKR